jgi:hypothetical protein
MTTSSGQMPAHLTVTKPAPSLCYLLRHFVINDIRELGRKTGALITGRRPPYVAAEQYAPPDSQACRKALALVREASPDFLFGHCLRSHAFAVAMAHKVKARVDREVLFLGCIMHDLGLTPSHDHGNSFELDGARTARSFCLHEGLAVNRADLVHEMIALHTSIGVADKREPEVALIHYSTGADVVGLCIHDINSRTLAEILQETPRDGFGEGMARLIDDQVKRKPDCYMASMVRLGFLKQLRRARLPGEPG